MRLLRQSKFSRGRAVFRKWCPGWLAVFCVGIIHVGAYGSQPGVKNSPSRMPDAGALLISDIHFDPFQDPAKVGRLATTPIDHWAEILNGPPSADQAVAFAGVRDKCGKDVFDASPALLNATVHEVAAKRQAVAFSVLTGDLVAHDFFCRYEATLPGRSHEEAQVFLERTIQYVIGVLSRAMGDRPLYVALGNNDSNCGDYRLDEHDRLFRDLLTSVAHAAHVPASALAAQGFERSGHFTALLPAPMHNAHIVVVDDLPSSSRFLTCSGARESRRSEEDLAWLTKQLVAARASRENVWFAAHIPPGVDPRPTLFATAVCTSRKPTMFLSSDALAMTLVGFQDVVKLALFAHTHMDEIRILAADDEGRSSPFSGIPVKLVPSISPVAGNRPSFLIATVDPKTAVMSDYARYAAPASDPLGGWVLTYSFRQAYGESSFSVPALAHLLNRFGTDSPRAREEADGYIERYSLGAPKFGIAPVWNTYRCVFRSQTPEQFLDCACPLDKTSIRKTQ